MARGPDGRFTKGHPKPPGSGRKPGQANEITTVIKSAVLETFDEMGRKRYLTALALFRPELYVKLLEKVLPQELKMDPESALPLLIIRDYTTGVANGVENDPSD